MSRKERRYRSARATERYLATRDLIAGRSSRTDGTDNRMPTDEGRSLIGHGRPRCRKARHDDQRILWGLKPIVPTKRAIALDLA